ncbi:hypothetical protein LAZ67_20002537 [Cordylochernes scorpioides]|uniref:Helix-turn-helix domain-containing protein n=1 Tax=Cordylochernes scorpioides TaxID=51811 RepID=A0ABY6LKY1_9ARAC|nr:hypothetical protein LAZ67_20002537 [Cordylochernes scorpioides]
MVKPQVFEISCLGELMRISWINNSSNEDLLGLADVLRKFGIRPVFVGSRSIGQLVRHPITKSQVKTEPSDQQNAVYSLSCQQCTASYVGETGRTVGTRVKEHIRNVKNRDSRSFIYQHEDSTGHHFNLQEVKGSPMGSPLSSPLAEIVMANIDHWVQQKIAPGIHMWRRYIDDIFCICDTGQEINILDSLNSYHPEISFTLELENRSVLPYLDILVIRTTSHYHTTVYHKVNNPTFYTDFNSSCPLSHKINTVRTLTKRLFTHCSLPLFRTIEFSLIIKQLARSQYPPPPHFIHKYKFDPSSVRPPAITRNSCLLPFSTQSVAISRILRTHGINTHFTNSNSIGAILRHPITRLPRSTVARSSGGSVYSVSCNDCSASYIGETGRSVAIRMTEHGRCIANRDNRSLIFNHINTTGHSFNLSSPTTLYSNVNTKYQRLIIEAILSINNHSINRHIDIPSQYLDICNNL